MRKNRVKDSVFIFLLLQEVIEKDTAKSKDQYSDYDGGLGSLHNVLLMSAVVLT